MAFQFPDPAVTPEFEGDNGITYIWDAADGKWSIKGFSADFDDRYVNEEGGDSMEGPLKVTGDRNPNAEGIESTVRVLNVDSGQNSSLQLRHGGNAKVYIGDTDVAIASDIKVARPAGSIVKTDDADLMTIVGEEISYTGNIESEKNLVTKKYVDDADEELRQSIITIDEELESIAPSTQRGQWAYEQAQDPYRPPASGKYFLIKGITAASDIGLAQFTEDYTEATGAVFSPIDNADVNHTWSDVEAEELIDLLDKPDPDGLFGTITDIDTTTHSNGAAIIIFDPIQSIGSPTNNQPYLTNVKVFTAPTGGTASEFVKKSGDTMTGDLTIDRSTGTNNVETKLTLIGERTSTTNPAAAIKFENKNSTAIGYLTYKSHGGDSWFTFTQDVDLNSKGLHSVKQIRMNSGAYIGSGTSQRIIVRTGNGNDNNACTQIQRPADGRRTFAIRGKKKSASSQSDIFWAYANSGTTGDAIHYTGIITSDNHILNRGYANSHYVKGNYTITKSNGNYYIQ